MTRFALLLVLALAASARAQSVPEFAVGDLDDLSVRVVRRPAKTEALLLVVEVKNSGKLTAEPLTFEVSIDVEDGGGRFTRFRHHRAGRRTWGRAGRAVKPGGKTRYRLPGPWGDQTPLDRVRVTVSRASFFRGRSMKKAPVKVLRTDSFDHFDDFTKTTSKMTRAVLKNTSDHQVTVILLATPRTSDLVSIVHAHLAPGETRSIGKSLADGTDAVASERIGLPHLFGRVRKLEVVDWSVLVDPGHGDAAERLERAWRERYRWPVAGGSTVAGEIEFALRDHRTSRDLRGTATFELPFSGAARLEPSTPLDDEGRRTLLDALGTAVAEIRQPSWSRLRDENDIELLDRSETGLTVLLRARKTRERTLRFPVLTIEEGRIVAASQEGMGTHKTVRWTNRVLPDGRYTPRGEERFSSNLPAWVRSLGTSTREWDDEMSDPAFPRTTSIATLGMLDGKPELEGTVELRGLELKGGREAGAPAGDGAAALRAAWSRPWRYPAGTRDLAGSLKIDADATAENWLGNAKLQGRVKLTAWNGRRGAVHGGLAFRPKGEISSEGKTRLSELAQARLTIWTRQDFAGRADFEDEFRGCTITRTGDDLFTIDGSERVASVRLAEGVPVEVVEKNGTRHVRQFSRVGGALVATRTEWTFESHHAILKTGWKKVGRDLLFPARIEIADWFGPDWGPEVFTFRVKEI